MHSARDIEMMTDSYLTSLDTHELHDPKPIDIAVTYLLGEIAQQVARANELAERVATALESMRVQG